MVRIVNAITNSEEHEEIEITLEMIEAGVRAYRERDSRFMLDRDIVEEIFIAMAEAQANRPADS